jgi:hypothetical protein
MEETNLIVHNSRNGLGHFKKAFESPAALYEMAIAYFEQLHNNPIYTSEQLRKPGKETIIPIKDSNGNETLQVIPPEHLIEMPRKRAASWQGFALFCGCCNAYFNQFRNKVKSGDIKDTEGHWENVVEMIGDMIFSYNFEAASAEQLNPMLIARYLGISDKIETKNETKVKREVFKLGDMEFEL